MSIDDKAITVGPPSDVLGFSSSAAIALNVRAARITGQITQSTYVDMSLLKQGFASFFRLSISPPTLLDVCTGLTPVLAIYSSHDSFESSFIDEVQNILNALHDIKATMPAQYQMDMRDSRLRIAGRLFSELDQETARTGSSLYLSVHQVCLVYPSYPSKWE